MLYVQAVVGLATALTKSMTSNEDDGLKKDVRDVVAVQKKQSEQLDALSHSVQEMSQLLRQVLKPNQPSL